MTPSELRRLVGVPLRITRRGTSRQWDIILDGTVRKHSITGAVQFPGWSRRINERQWVPMKMGINPNNHHIELLSDVKARQRQSHERQRSLYAGFDLAG